MQDAFEVRIAHADVVHVVERVADVVDARAADANPLRDQPCASMQVELPHVGRVIRIGDECEGAHGFPAELHRNEPRLIHPARHLAIPKPCQRAAQTRGVDAVGHTPAGAALAKTHDEARLACRAAVARGKDAERAVVAMGAAERFLGIVEARRPHERAIAKYPKVAFRQLCAELSQVHRCARIIESARCPHAARR